MTKPNANVNTNVTTIGEARRAITDLSRTTKNMDFETAERATGKVWIDGKMIYRRVVNFGALPDTTSKAIGTSTSAGVIDFVTDLYLIAYNGSDEWAAIPHLSSALRIINNGTHVDVTSSSDLSGWTSSYVVMEFTKA